MIAVVSLEQFRAWSPQGLRDAASDLSGNLRTILGISDQLDVSGRPTGWHGEAAGAAHAALGRLTAGIREAAADSAAVRTAVEAAATEIEAQLQALVRIETWAAGHGLDVAPDGRVTDVAPVPRPLDLAAGPVAAMARQGLVDDVAQQLRALLEQADGTDARLARVLGDVDMRSPVVHPAMSAGQIAAAAAGTGPAPPAAQNGDPAAANAWWASLSPEQRDVAIGTRPAEIGNLDGVPARDRDRANRIEFAAELDEVHAATARLHTSTRPEDEAELERLLPVQGGLEQMQRAMAPTPDGRPGALLLGFRDTDPGPGQFIMARGNPDTSANVATMVTGMGSSYGSSIDRMDRLTRQVDSLTLDPASSSIVSFADYSTPQNYWSASGEEQAVAGAPSLREFQQGLRATHEADSPSSNTVVAHSYGSVVTGHAARDLSAGGLDADQIIALGSPGMGVESVAELHRDPGRVWAAGTWAEVVTYAPFHGPPPHGMHFGAHILDSSVMGDHSSYFVEGSTTLEGIGNIVVGNADPFSGQTQ